MLKKGAGQMPCYPVSNAAAASGLNRSHVYGLPAFPAVFFLYTCMNSGLCYVECSCQQSAYSCLDIDRASTKSDTSETLAQLQVTVTQASRSSGSANSAQQDSSTGGLLQPKVGLNASSVAA